MQHKAFWSALEYICRLLGISTAAGKSKFSFSLALKGIEWVLGPPGCLPAFGQLQPLPYPVRGTKKHAHFCFGTQGGRVLGAWPGSFLMLFPNAVGSTVRHQKGIANIQRSSKSTKKKKKTKLYSSKTDIGIGKM